MGWGMVRGTYLFLRNVFRNIPTYMYLCEIPVSIIVKRMKHFLCPSHRLIPKLYFLSTKMLQLKHTRMSQRHMKRDSKLPVYEPWFYVYVKSIILWVDTLPRTGIPGEVILEDHDEYLDHLLELHRPRPVLVIQAELPPELLLRRTRGLGSDPKHQLRQIF